MNLDNVHEAAEFERRWGVSLDSGSSSLLAGEYIPMGSVNSEYGGPLSSSTSTNLISGSDPTEAGSEIGSYDTPQRVAYKDGKPKLNVDIEDVPRDSYSKRTHTLSEALQHADSDD